MQGALPLPSRRTVTPASDRPQPRFWVRTLAVLRELEFGVQHEIQRIDLHLGLNVLWARPARVAVPRPLFEGSVSGHDAGKTTFCRFLRHLLGEPTFGTKALRERLRLHFPSGWIVGEVVVDGRPWTVGRPIGIGPHPFAVPDAQLDDVLRDERRGSFAEYEAALWAAVGADLPIDRLPQSSAQLGWLHVLPWLARDQEARFTSFATWRDTDSEAEAGETTLEDRHAIMRAVLGLLSSEEARAQAEATRLLAQLAQHRSALPLLAHTVFVARRALAEQLHVPVDDGPLFETLLTKRLADLRAVAPSNDANLDLSASLAPTADALTLAAIALKEARQRADHLNTTRKAMTGNDVNAMFRELSTTGDRCNVPMRLAVESKCPLAKERPIRIDERGFATAAAEALASLSADVRNCDELVRHATDVHAQAKRSHEQALADVAARAEAQQRATAEHARRTLRAEFLEAQWTAVQEARRRHAEAEQAIAQCETDLEARRDEMRRLREQNATERGALSEVYELTIRALLGDTCHAQIHERGRELQLQAHQRGEVRGAALSTIKLLAFDLAAMTASIEGRGAFPRFLVHDGPREADLDEVLYQRVFLFARLLESAFEGEPNFQYIVTTTAPPPDEVCSGRWMLQPILDASTAAGRFLGVDL